MSIIEKAVDRLNKEEHEGASELSEAPNQHENDVTDQGLGKAELPEKSLDGEKESAEDLIDVHIRDLNIEGVISPDGDRGRSAEEFRMIKRPLLQNAFDAASHTGPHANLIMITSAIAGEGKTFSSLNLAISMAMEMDRTVLLIDADVARPGLSRILRIDEKPGLLDCLDTTAKNLGEVLLRTDVAKLTLLPAGNQHIRSTELLGSRSMHSMLDEIALRYPDRIVLFDSPPLLETSEARVLAGQMGQIVLVVESAVTRQYLVKEALSQLDSTENVSLILNKTNSSAVFSRYGYGYGYRYGYGYGQQGEK